MVLFAFTSILLNNFVRILIEIGLIFKESIACTTSETFNLYTKEQLLEQLKQSSISCKNVSFRVLGLSLASINSIFSITLSVIFLRLFINYGKN